MKDWEKERAIEMVDRLKKSGLLCVVLVIQKTVVMRCPGGWPIQARFWLEWGSSIAGQSLPAARSRFRAVHSDSISIRPREPVA
jgi:hypothetical protein